GLHGDRAHVYDETGHRELHHVKGHYSVEFDGRQHAEDMVQFQRDADRWRAIGDEGWHLVRILNHHLEPDPSVALDIVRRALLRAGWRP
ncbi:DUF559 domain-containing protein, partial [Microbacterium trichothecenolyticum]